MKLRLLLFALPAALAVGAALVSARPDGPPAMHAPARPHDARVVRAGNAPLPGAGLAPTGASDARDARLAASRAADAAASENRSALYVENLARLEEAAEAAEAEGDAEYARALRARIEHLHRQADAEEADAEEADAPGGG